MSAAAAVDASVKAARRTGVLPSTLHSARTPDYVRPGERALVDPGRGYPYGSVVSANGEISARGGSHSQLVDALHYHYELICGVKVFEVHLYGLLLIFGCFVIYIRARAESFSPQAPKPVFVPTSGDCAVYLDPRRIVRRVSTRGGLCVRYLPLRGDVRGGLCVRVSTGGVRRVSTRGGSAVLNLNPRGLCVRYIPLRGGCPRGCASGVSTGGGAACLNRAGCRRIPTRGGCRRI